MAERKTRTSTQVKAKYNQKTYDVISIRVPKEIAQSFKEKCKNDGVSQANIIKSAIVDFLKR